MKYNIKSHRTEYNGVSFRSRLEARWACFFDLVGWKWDYEPIDIRGWTPDFRVEFPCGHSECGGSHTLLVEIKPYYDIEEFEGHPCLKYPYGVNQEEEQIPANASAAFGIDPHVSYWEMSHGAGAGEENIVNHGWAGDHIDEKWKEAGNITQWKK